MRLGRLMLPVLTAEGRTTERIPGKVIHTLLQSDCIESQSCRDGQCHSACTKLQVGFTVETQTGGPVSIDRDVPSDFLSPCQLQSPAELGGVVLH